MNILCSIRIKLTIAMTVIFLEIEFADVYNFKN